MGVLDKYKMNYEDIKTMKQIKADTKNIRTKAVKQPKKKELKTLTLAIRFRLGRVWGLPVALSVERVKKSKALVITVLFIEVARISYE